VAHRSDRQRSWRRIGRIEVSMTSLRSMSGPNRYV
jgi:hypothetical protein